MFSASQEIMSRVEQSGLWDGPSGIWGPDLRSLSLPVFWGNEARSTWVRSLGWEDPLEKGMAMHSSILAWRIPWTQEPGELQSIGSQRFRYDWMTNIFVTPYSFLACFLQMSQGSYLVSVWKDLYSLRLWTIWLPVASAIYWVQAVKVR